MSTVVKSTVSALIVLASVSAAQARSMECPTISETEIEGLFTSFNEAWATKDPAKVTALFTRKPVLLATVSNQPRTTPEAVNDYFVKFLKSSPVGRIDSSTIELDCNTATRLGTWTVTLTDPASGAKTDVKARYSFIYRYEEGAWKIDHLHSSMMPEK
ncbi:SgcJ/EcaC family oxidoreductase [Bradyrhizobium sp. STM 3809]|uniref:SgcJ/EcaC family oxidoreductase n=1 Tax=Bradyrhizobium sp. STM 3809 TaxID=551936 RepID=UPI00024097F0|nr:SgcJ/EcaC family oxidoreductase [Bradyrhizobium sp. STM 3809]CCE01361.1 conserved exported hypothetical protein [Bradyrhizobium sp. STM 3809]